MEKTFTVATFNDRVPADALTARLRGAGFDADLFDESSAQKWLMLNLKPRAHMRVRVPNVEGERALQTLREWPDSAVLLKDAVHCPQCQSSRVEFPQFSRRTLMSALPAAAAAAGLIEQQYFCEACGYTWDPNPKTPETLDVLNWPQGTKVP
jgi:rubredoxin